MGGAVNFIAPVISTGLGMMAQYRQVKAYNSQLEANAAAYEAQAGAARTKGAFDLSLLRREHAQGMGRMAQGLTNSGVSLSGGSALLQLAEQRGLNARAEQVQEYNTELEAWGYQSKAAQARSQKQSAWGAAMSTAVSGFGAISRNFGAYNAAVRAAAPVNYASLGGSYGYTPSGYRYSYGWP